jgi:hypothetical protein
MSSDGKIVLEVESRMGAVMRDQAELNKALGQLNEKVVTLDKGAKTVGATFSQMQRAAARVYADEAKGVETLKQKQLELNALFKAGQLDKQTYANQSAKINQELLRFDVEHQKMLEQEAKKLQAKQELETRVYQTKMKSEQDLLQAGLKYAAANESADVKRKRAMLELNTLRHQGLITEEQHSAEVKKLGDVGESAFGKMISGAGNTAKAIVGITTVSAIALKALQMIGAEMDANAQRGERAADHQLSLTRSTRAMIRNLGVGSGSQFTPAAAVAEVQNIAAATGATQAAVMEAGGGVLSARGSFDERTAFDALRKTATLDPSLGGKEMALLSGSALDIRKAFGGTNEQALGMLMAGQQTARVEEVGQYAQNIIPAVLGLSSESYGLNAKEAFGLTSTFTLLSGDKRGAESGTGAIQFVKQVVEATNQVRGKKFGSFSERLEFLRSDPQGRQIRNTMVGVLGGQLTQAKRAGGPGAELTGEARSLPSMIGLLTDGSKAQAEYGAMMAATPSMDAADELYRANLASQNSVGLLRVAKVDEGFNAQLEKIKSDTGRGMSGTITRRLDQLNKELGIGTVVGDQVRNRLTQIRMTGADEVQALEIGESELRDQAANVGGVGTRRSFLGNPLPNYVAPTADQQKSQQDLLIVADALKALIAELKADRQSRGSRTSPNGPRPALQQSAPTEP